MKQEVGSKKRKSEIRTGAKRSSPKVNPKSAIRNLKKEVGSQKSEVRSQKYEVGSKKRKSKIRIPHSEISNPKFSLSPSPCPLVSFFESEIRTGAKRRPMKVNPKSEISNPKSESEIQKTLPLHPQN
jgi:hypothetical protein